MRNLLPPNATNLEIALSCAMQSPALPMPVKDLWNPDTCPAGLLPWLAWSLAVDNWSDDWTEAAKRQRIKSAIWIHKHKGTVAAVETALDALGAAATITEWWQTDPPGTPHTFAIDVAATDLTPDQRRAPYIASVIREVTRVKPLRSHFTFSLSVAASGGVGVFAAGRLAAFLRLEFAA